MAAAEARGRVVVAVAPNGGRKTKADHPALPLSADELARTAAECLDRGASMESPGGGGNGQSAILGCLWNGRGKAAALLAAGASDSLYAAAGAPKARQPAACQTSGSPRPL